MATIKRSAFDEWKDGTRRFPIITKADFIGAIRQFKKAIKKDKTYARAYGWLAYTIITGHIDDWVFPEPERSMTAKQRIKMACELADHAVDLDPGDYDTHWAQAYVRLHTGDAKGAEAAFNTARALNHGNRELLSENADERVYAGDTDKAIELVMRARDIPDWNRWVLAWAYYFKARRETCFYDMAVRELQCLKEEPGQGRTPAEIFILLAAIYGQKSLLKKNLSARQDRGRAIQNRKNYEKAHGTKLSLKVIESTNPFRKPVDGKHWLSGLKAAGVK